MYRSLRTHRLDELDQLAAEVTASAGARRLFLGYHRALRNRSSDGGEGVVPPGTDRPVVGTSAYDSDGSAPVRAFSRGGASTSIP